MTATADGRGAGPYVGGGEPPDENANGRGVAAGAGGSGQANPKRATAKTMGIARTAPTTRSGPDTGRFIPLPLPSLSGWKGAGRRKRESGPEKHSETRRRIPHGYDRDDLAPDVRPQDDRAPLAGTLGGACPLPGPRRLAQAEVLHARDAALPIGRSPRRSRQELHAGRRRRAHDAHARLQRAAPDGLGRLRPSGGERGYPAGHRSGALDPAEHRQHAAPAPPAGNVVRLVARDRHVRPGVLPLESVVLSQDVRAGTGL